MLTALIVAFVFISLISFGVFAFVMRPDKEQKAMTRRVVSIRTPQGEFTESVENLENYLNQKPASSFQWLEDLVQKSKFSRDMQVLIIQSDGKTSIGNVLMTSMAIALGIALVVYLFTGMLLGAALVGGVTGIVPTAYLKFKRTRRLNAFNATLPECIDMMGRSLRAGHSIVAAIGIVADQALEPAKSEFGEVFKKQNYGLPMRDALMQMLDRMPSQDLRVLITAILVQKDTGGNLAEILDRTTNVIRERIRIKGEISTHTAQGRLTGWILCLLPVVLLVLINIVNPGYSKVLIDTETGRKLLYAGVGLLCLGGFLIRGIINGIEV
jgi:tight adherence protein B